MKEILFCVAPYKILVVIPNNKETYANQLAKKSGVTYSHTCKILEELKKEKIITERKNGRTIYLKLTEKGIKIKKNLLEIIKEVK